MKLPYIFVFNLKTIISIDTNIIHEYNILKIIHKFCKMDNIINKCIDKYDFTEELEKGLLRPNFKDFIEFLKKKFINIEFYISSLPNQNDIFLNGGIISNIETLANMKFNKPYLNNYNTIDNLFKIIIDNLSSKYPSLQKNKEYVLQNQLILFDIDDIEHNKLLSPVYNYSVYYDIKSKLLNKYGLKEDIFDNKEVLNYFSNKDLVIYNKNGSIYQQDMQLQLLLELYYIRQAEINNKNIKDTYFNDLIMILKRKRKFDNKTFISINDKINKNNNIGK